jgi:hypothetical protein
MKLSEIPWLVCPNSQCNQFGSIVVEARACIKIQDPNEETKYLIEEIYLEEDCQCCCNSCGFSGILKDFIKKNLNENLA